MFARMTHPSPLYHAIPQLSALKFGKDHERPKDTLSKTSSISLLDLFGIRLDQIHAVQGVKKQPISLPENEKRAIIEHYLAAHELVLKHQKVTNFSGDYYGAAVELEDGTWEIGTNIESSAQDRSCGERISMLVAWNQSVRNQSSPLERKTSTTDDYSDSSKATQTKAAQTPKEGMRVKRIILSQSTIGKHLVPCSDCQGWMTGQQFFSPQTQIVTLSPGGNPDEYQLWLRNLKDLLPFWGEHKASLSQKPVHTLPVQFSEKAQESFQLRKKEGHVDEAVLARMMRKAQKAYLNNATTDFTGKRVGVAVLLSSGHIVSEGRFEWHKRTIDPADMRAAAYGITKVKRWRARSQRAWHKIAQWLPGFLSRWIETGFHALRQTLEKTLPVSGYRLVKKIIPPEPIVKAIAYYGDMPQEIPSIRSLGFFAKRNHGGPDTLILTLENDRLMTRTIQDYMAEIYVSATDKAKV